MARPAPPEESLLAFVVAPIAGGMLFVALVGLMVFLNMARRKRSLHGTYNPQKQVGQTYNTSSATTTNSMTLFLMLTVLFQELAAPRLELDYMLKLPAEERLI